MSNMENRTKIAFAAIDKRIEDNIIHPTESATNGKDWIMWGDGNSYPQYLRELYDEVPTLSSIIDGCVNFTSGDGAKLNYPLKDGSMNKTGETIDDLITKLAFDYWSFGGFAILVIPNLLKDRVAEVYHLPLQFIRTNKDSDVFWYSEQWGQRYGRNNTALVYPKFLINNYDRPSVFFFKNSVSSSYPKAVYHAAVKACEIERSIDDYHLSSLGNGFSPSYMISFNNGVPTDEEKEEIERDINEKFAGVENVGRFMLSFADTKENALTLEQIHTEDFGERYKSLADRSRQAIFTSFRANPNLFGIPTENLGFSSEEYESAFQLFNKTQIQPVQAKIIDAFDKIFAMKSSVEITPFSLNFDKIKLIKYGKY